MAHGMLSWGQRIELSFTNDEKIVQVASEFDVNDPNVFCLLGNAHQFSVPNSAQDISVEESVSAGGDLNPIGEYLLQGRVSDRHVHSDGTLFVHPKTKSLHDVSKFSLVVRYSLLWNRPAHANFNVEVELNIFVADYLKSMGFEKTRESLNQLYVLLHAPPGCNWDQKKSPKDILTKGIQQFGCLILSLPKTDPKVENKCISFLLRPNERGLSAAKATAAFQLPVSQDLVQRAQYTAQMRKDVDETPGEEVVVFVCDLRGSTSKTEEGKPSRDVLEYHAIWHREKVAPFRLLKIIGDQIFVVCEPASFLDGGFSEISRCYQQSLDLGIEIRGGFHKGPAIAIGPASEEMSGSVIGEDFLGDALNHGAKIGDFKGNQHGLIASQEWINWMKVSGLEQNATYWQDMSIGPTVVKLYRVEPSSISKNAHRNAMASAAPTFPERLIARAKIRTSRLIVGLDPDLARFPNFLKARWRDNSSLSALEDIIVEFNDAIIEATHKVAAAFKPQIAFYEQFGEAGLRALHRTIASLRNRDEIIILDAKRNDIQHTARAYADAWLGAYMPFSGRLNEQRVDAITVNGYLGADGVLPFLEADRQGGIFVLAKTSNPTSADVQDLKLDSGKPIYQHMAELANVWGKQDGVGPAGYSRVGLVVGATHPQACEAIRAAAPSSLFLMPGLGAQGGSADAIAKSAGADGYGAFASSSRSVLYGFPQRDAETSRWRDAVVEGASHEAVRLRDAINAALKS